MAHIDVPAGNDPERTRMWQMVPPMQKATKVFSHAMHEEGTLTTREREVARMRIAEINTCPI